MKKARIGRKTLRVEMDEINRASCQVCYDDVPAGILTHIGGKMRCPRCAREYEGMKAQQEPGRISNLHSDGRPFKNRLTEANGEKLANLVRGISPAPLRRRPFTPSDAASDFSIMPAVAVL